MNSEVDKSRPDKTGAILDCSNSKVTKTEMISKFNSDYGLLYCKFRLRSC